MCIVRFGGIGGRGAKRSCPEIPPRSGAAASRSGGVAERSGVEPELRDAAAELRNPRMNNKSQDAKKRSETNNGTNMH